jgi:hypothetical protein
MQPPGYRELGEGYPKLLAVPKFSLTEYLDVRAFCGRRHYLLILS